MPFIATKSIHGDEIKPGMYRQIGWNRDRIVESVEPGQHEQGARFQTLTMVDGTTDVVWAGFKYRVSVRGLYWSEGGDEARIQKLLADGWVIREITPEQETAK